jgi:hypothetical protein
MTIAFGEVAHPPFYLFRLRSVCFAMLKVSPLDEKSFLELDDDKTGEYINVRLPCINANHVFQITSGSGRMQTRKGGKK